MRGRYNTADAVDAAKNQVPLIVFKPNKPMDKGRNGARYFRNPPQPHMCIQDFIEDNNEPCFINVLSWVKISTPRKPEDPIPLYGGMRVPHNSSAALSLSSHFGATGQPVIFAVMANPEILRLSGKTAPDPSDRDALVELMIDFVEAMNPDIRFKRRFTVLRDRDLAGELKDIWLAVQAKRERERGENGKRGDSDKCRENREDSWRDEARQKSKSSDRIPDRATHVPVSVHDQESIDITTQENTVSLQEGCNYNAEDIERVVERQLKRAEERSSLSPEAHVLTPSTNPSCNEINQSIGAMNYADESVYSLIRTHYAEEFQSIGVDAEDAMREQNLTACTDNVPGDDNSSKSVYPVYPGYQGECQGASPIAQAVHDVNSSQIVVQSNSSAFAKYKRPENHTDTNIFSSTDSNIHESLVLDDSPIVCEQNTPFKDKDNLSMQEEKSNLRNSNSGLCMASVDDHIYAEYAGEEVFSSSKSQVPNVAGRSHEDLLPNLNESQGVKIAIGADHNSSAIP